MAEAKAAGKILLAACNAKYIHSNLAVYDLMAFAGAYREHIVLKEYTINQLKDDILKDIYLEQPDVLCVSCYIWNISFVKSLMREIRKLFPQMPIWAGGPEVSFDATEFLAANDEFAGVLVGEGEETFQELVKHYVDQDRDLSEIRGLAYRAGDQVIHNGWREILDLSRVPFPYKDLEDFRNRIIYYESSRGCPFSCSYCLSSVDKRLRFRDLELVKKELQFFLDHKVPQVKFVDRTFNCKHSHAMGIWQYLKEHDNGITNFHFEVSADLLNEEELQLLESLRPGQIQLEIGVQSTNQETITAIRRTMDLERLSETVKRIRSYRNIHQHLDLIAGLPYEDYDSFRKSFNDVYALRPDQLQLGFLKVLKGSHMKEMEAEYGIVHKDEEPYEVLYTKWLPYRDVLRLKMVENMVEIYYNSGQFLHTLAYIEEFFTDAFSFYQTLGEFYEKKGYASVSHSRMRRYEILMEFLREETDADEKHVADAMIYDLYVRENLKSKPAFARDQKPFETQIWEYRKREKVPKTSHIQVMWDERVIRFDYDKRDPLDGNACAQDLTSVIK